MNKDLVILAGDPGTKNFGLSVIKYKNGDLDYPEILFCNFFKSPIQELKNETFNIQLLALNAEIQAIIEEFKPNFIVLERFQGRGIRGSLAEKVSMSVMGIAEMGNLSNIKTRLITASQWKNFFNKNKFRKLVDVYSHAKSLYKLEPHLIDATFIGMYATDNKSCYNWLKSIKKFDNLIKDIATKSAKIKK